MNSLNRRNNFKNKRGKIMSKKMVFLLVCAVVIISLPYHLYAEGYALYNLGSDAGGRAEAVTSSVNDASAIWFNPARMVEVNKSNLVAGFDYMLIDLSIKSIADNKTYDMTDDNAFLPHAYYVYTMNEQLALGLGINTPFGLNVEYEKTVPWRYTVTQNSLEIMNIMPAAAYRINDKLSVGGGLMIFLADAEAHKQYPWVALGMGSVDGEVALEGDGTQIGGMAGVSYMMNEYETLSLVYRSQMRIELDGDLSLSQIPAGLHTASSYSTGATANAVIPDTVILGLACSRIEKLLLEVNLNWRNWDDLTTMTVEADNTFNSLLLPKQTVTTHNWKNGGELVIGALHTINETWAMDYGLMYSKTPVRETYATAEIPDTSYYLVSAGPVYTRGDLKVQMPLAYLDNFKKDVNSSAGQADGEWDLSVFHIGLGVSWNF
ncbi:MAG: hypothetical protein GF384_01450 [Elusimicrobia bacterium]|nr:hypothetical protein [Elusimicrobiota bacterium]MBD3411686.1 hypothetical protein [Elusimicrobiota bacterium]